MVLQSVSPYMSEQDNEKGSRWALKIGAELESANFGIVVVTPFNQRAPWLLYEAGALSKKLGDFMPPLVVGLRPSDLEGPLSAFHATQPTLEDITRLVADINAAGDLGVTAQRLAPTVERWWPDLESRISSAPKDDTATVEPPRSASSI